MATTVGNHRKPRSLRLLLAGSISIVALGVALLAWHVLSGESARLSGSQLRMNPDGSLLYPSSELVSTIARDEGGEALDGSAVYPAIVQRDARATTSFSTVAAWYSTQLAARGWTPRGTDSHTRAELFTRGDLDLIVEPYSGSASYLPGASGYGVTHPATYSVVIAQAPRGCQSFPPPLMLGITLTEGSRSSC